MVIQLTPNPGWFCCDMHSLLSLHSLTSLPAMLDLSYLEHFAFGEG